MDTKEYSLWVEGKIITEGDTRLIENTLGLVGEAGEVAEKIKKMLRDGTELSSYDLMKELGDVVFYATSLANKVGGSLTEILRINVAKLDDRAERDVIKGSGDNR